MQLLQFSIIILFSISCSENPTKDESQYKNFKKSVFILCEGQWGLGNSRLDEINLENFEVNKDIYGKINNNSFLGDIANDIVLKGDTAFISVTTSKSIEVLNLKENKFIGRMIFEGKRAPRKIFILNDTLAYVTDLYDYSVSLFNPSTLEIKNEKIIVGPAPEGIEYNNGKLYVVNSGYGDYLKDKENASTISVIDINTNKVERFIPTGLDPIKIKFNPVNKLFYLLYKNLPSNKDSLGGIIVYDNSFNLLKEVKGAFSDFSIDKSGQIWIVNQEGVFTLSNNSFEISKVIDNPNKNQFWYSINTLVDENLIVIGNAYNYTIEGKIMFYQRDSKIKLAEVQTGVNPNTILLFKK